MKITYKGVTRFMTGSVVFSTEDTKEVGDAHGKQLLKIYPKLFVAVDEPEVKAESKPEVKPRTKKAKAKSEDTVKLDK